jgi:S-(hydroxymethyl)glutathione dehydrogenase/alcohol dehydrogenase
MKALAAVLWGVGESWSIEEVDLDEPEPSEVLVRMVAAGICRSDEHLVTGDLPIAFPAVGGHEGSAVVERVGSSVFSLEPGDHVVMSFIPSCGRCRWCSTGRQTLCDLGRYLMLGTPIANGVHRMRARGQGVGPMSLVGCFATHQVVHESSLVKVDPDVCLENAALLSCGVTTGFGSAVHTAGVKPGDVSVVVGTGGVGLNAVQGARIAGARSIVAVDPLPAKRDAAKRLGATHVAADAFAAYSIVNELTRGELADSAVIAVDVLSGDLIGPVMSLVRKGGAVVVTALAPFGSSQVNMSLFELSLWMKELRGSLFGGGNPRSDIPMLLKLNAEGLLELSDLVTKTYPLQAINEAFEDLRAGRNLRGLLAFE